MVVEHRPAAEELRFVIHFEEDGVEIEADLPKIARDCPRLPKLAQDCPRLPRIARVEADLPDETIVLLAGSTTHCECPTCSERNPKGRRLL